MAVKESKHDRFLRLMQRRLERALHELRLVSQLSSENYDNTPEEAEEVISILDKQVRNIAFIFDVEYASRIGKSATNTVGGAKVINSPLKKVTILDEIEIVKALELLRAGNINQVEGILRSSINGRS